MYANWHRTTRFHEGIERIFAKMELGWVRFLLRLNGWRRDWYARDLDLVSIESMSVRRKLRDRQSELRQRLDHAD
jgi:hypothetical protein